jgi:hypothetical protein
MGNEATVHWAEQWESSYLSNFWFLSHKRKQSNALDSGGLRTLRSALAVSSNTQHKNCLIILNAILPFLKFSQQSNDQAYVFERSAFPTNPCSLKSHLTTSLAQSMLADQHIS